MESELSTGEARRTIIRREVIVRSLAARDEPVCKPVLAETAGVSRSTVDRAIRELSGIGFVDRCDEGYVLTVAGRLALEELDRTRSTSSSIEAASPLLDHVSADAPVSPVLFDDATVHVLRAPPAVLKPTAHAHLVELIVERIRGADRVYGFTPVEPNPRIRNTFYDVTVDGDVPCEIILTPELASYFLGNEGSQVSRLVAAGNMDLLEAPSLPYGLGIYQTDESITVQVFPYGETARLQGVVENASPNAVAWADAVFRYYRDRATPLAVNDRT